jgi:uncharacterized membrane protein YfcA
VSDVITVRGILVFAAIVFVGSLLGNWILNIFQVGDDPLGQVIAFFVPTVVIYYIWKKWGERVAED